MRRAPSCIPRMCSHACAFRGKTRWICTHSSPLTTARSTPTCRAIMTERKKRIVVGISGASGAVIGVRLLAALRRLGTHETHLVVSASGAVTAAQELGLARGDIDALA